MKDDLSGLAAGSVAGCAATVPMTLLMDALHAALPPHEREPLPPRQITENAAGLAGVLHRLDESDRHGLSLLAHFG